MAALSAPVALLTASLGFAALHGIVHWGVCSLLAARCSWFASLSAEKQAESTIQAVWLLLGLQLPVLYAAASLELWESAAQRWEGTSALAEWGLTLHIGQSIYESCLHAWPPPLPRSNAKHETCAHARDCVAP